MLCAPTTLICVLLKKNITNRKPFNVNKLQSSSVNCTQQQVGTRMPKAGNNFTVAFRRQEVI